METKLMDLLQEFAYNLQELSAKPIDEMEIIFPYENYKMLEFELYNCGLIKSPLRYGTPDTKIKVQTISGLGFNISCKELNDQLIRVKLQECFKILSK